MACRALCDVGHQGVISQWVGDIVSGEEGQIEIRPMSFGDQKPEQASTPFLGKRRRTVTKALHQCLASPGRLIDHRVTGEDDIPFGQMQILGIPGYRTEP